MFERLREDIRTVYAKDPAARTTLEVITCYPGLHAIWFHRLAHYLWIHELRFFARLLSHLARFLTGIEIHPGATIDRRFFIDHGMGIVIGETTEIGTDVLLYQGVVLGGTSNVKHKRHPTIGNNVVIGSGAIVLGPITVGDGARVGAGSVVVKPVPAGMTVVGVPARISGPKAPVQRETELNHGGLPDPGLQALAQLASQQNALEQRVRDLERMLARRIPRGEPEPAPDFSVAADSRERILEALREVLDPEAGTNVVEMGLIHDIVLDNRHVEVRMALPEGICPFADLLVGLVRSKVEETLGDTAAGAVQVTLLDSAEAISRPEDMAGEGE